MYEITLIFALAFLFLITYFIGMYRNRKIAVNYARTIKEHMSPHSSFVGFRPYSRGGFRTLCKLKEKEPFTEIEMAVSLVDRENLMHYPLALLTKDKDRLACWGFFKDSVPLSMEILPIKEEKLCWKVASERGLIRVISDDDFYKHFAVLASNQEIADKFLSDHRLQKHILEMKAFIKRLSLSEKESRLYLIGELKEASSVKSLIDVFMHCGEHCRKFQR
ncbi:MAG: hypothetical protein QXY88_01210 [Candidatus Bathyarchaeia archaeon]